jgi:SAM-dependent methyltransferase
MSDFDDLAQGNEPNKNIYTYNKKMESLRKKISHELIISTTKESAYFQQRTNLAKPMRQFVNWIKDEMIWTFCHPMYQDNRQISVLDLGCGKGQDIMKWFFARALFYVGVDIDREGLINPVDGAWSRYRQLQKRPNFPKMYFLQADCGAELDIDSQKNALNTSYLENEEIYRKFFSKDQTKRTLFDRINCQLAIHYFLKNQDTWTNFKMNLKNYLRNGGYFLALTFDGRKIVELLGDNEKYTQYYTDENGKSKMLFEIVRKFEVPKSKSDIIGTGNAIDVYISWFSLEGRYLTEYLVDSQFLVKELASDCNLELVSTDSCENQLIIHQEYLNHYSKFEDIEKTRNMLSNVAQFYNQDNVNVNCRPWLNLFRYYIFRKNGKLEKQKGGVGRVNGDLDDSSDYDGNMDPLLNFSDKTQYLIPEMASYNNEFSCTNSLHHIMRSHKVIPKYITPQKFFNDLGVGPIRDTVVSDKIDELAHKMIVSEINDNDEEKVVVDGVNIFIVERDCNDAYDVELVKKNNKKIKDTDLSVILMKEGLWYVPVYYIDDEDKRIGLFESSHPVIKKLLDEV